MEIARQFRVDERSAFRQALYDQGIDWRLDVIDEMLPEGVGFGDSGLSAIIDSQQSDFHVREFTDPDNVKVPVRGERDKYSPLPRVIEEATSEEKAPQNPILHVDDIELTNTNGVAISLKRLLRNNPDANGVKFLHQPDNSFGGNGFNSETQEIRARVPTSLRDLYALFHELGHADDPKGIQYLSRLAEERHFGFEDSELNDKGENIDLVAHVNAERGAWARAYWMLKALRKTGFVNFNEQDLINQAEVSLQTYEDGSFAKERATSSCFYTSAMRKEQRTSGQSQ